MLSRSSTGVEWQNFDGRYRDLREYGEAFPWDKARVVDALISSKNKKFIYLCNDDLSGLLTLFSERKREIILFASKYAVFGVEQHILPSGPPRNPPVDFIEVGITELEAPGAGVKAARAGFEQFKQAVEASNKMLGEFQRVSFDNLLAENKEKILNLMIVMAPSRAFIYLATLASVSTKYLQRFLAGYTRMTFPLFIDLILSKFSATLADKRALTLWREILLTLSALLPTLEDETHLEGIRKAGSLEEAKNELVSVSKLVCIELLGLGACTGEVNPEKLDILINSSFWVDLVANISRLTKYKDWYKAMLACDITERSIDKLLHDVQQQNPGTLVIAQHNAQIRVGMVAAGLLPDKAVSYRKSHSFTYEKTIKIEADWQQIAKEIKKHLINFKSALEKSELIKNNNPILGLSKDIDKLLMELTKGNNGDAQLLERIQSAGIERLVNKLFARLQRNKDVLTSEVAGPEINDEVIELEGVIKQFMDAKPKTRQLKFRAQQWDKSRTDTFLLGNYLNCCMAANGLQTHAIVERRLDDAMPIHVVMDEETNKPVCSVWLFWAIDSLDEKLKLVANFIELNNAYSDDQKLLSTLVGNLLYFTGEMYLNDVVPDKKAPPFVMQKLTYGNVNQSGGHILDKFTQQTCQFEDKLGGQILGEYYLKSLKLDSFAVYTRAGLKAEFPDMRLMQEVSPASVRATLFGGGEDFAPIGAVSEESHFQMHAAR